MLTAMLYCGLQGPQGISRRKECVDEMAQVILRDMRSYRCRAAGPAGVERPTLGPLDIASYHWNDDDEEIP